MYIDCWVKKHTYDSFKEVLGSGLQCHLQVSAAAPPTAGVQRAFRTVRDSKFTSEGDVK